VTELSLYKCKCVKPDVYYMIIEKSYMIHRLFSLCN